MTSQEIKIQHFEKNAPSCRSHNQRPKYDFSGIHHVTCAKGCDTACAEEAQPDALFMRWDRENRR